MNYSHKHQHEVNFRNISLTEKKQDTEEYKQNSMFTELKNKQNSAPYCLGIHTYVVKVYFIKNKE